jgi:signal transduction histidine kinase
LGEEVRAHSFLQVAVELDDGASEKVSDAQAHELLHIAQEALANVRKHAGATAVVVRLFCTEDRIVLCVEDNGRGLFAGDVESDQLGDGLSNMRARARVLGGTLTVRPDPMQGTSVTVAVPISSPDAPKFR